MLRQSLSKRISVATAVAICLIARFVLSAPGGLPQASSASSESAATSSATTEVPQPTATDQQTTAPSVEQAFVGSNQCFVCHRPQTNTWSETNHAHAFTHLPEKYRNNNDCLNCHVTGFGDPRGYVAGTDKDLLMVGCESCHGPGARHVDSAQRFVLAATPDEEARIEKEMRETVVKTPTDEVCIACHKTQAHGSHPPFEDTLPAPTAGSSADHSNRVSFVTPRFTSTASQTRYVPGYSAKTCGSCHYDQYLQWRSEKHSALAESLPAKYAADQDCRKCHVNAGFARSPIPTDLPRTQLGVSCESCHGPAVEHIHFNVQFIHGPPLGPKLEQAARHSIQKGKPTAACIQCHVRHSHGEHPQFDK